jgi:NDP-sugar pyrophosphorylase family protein
MQIIIPMSGTGSRFIKAGYDLPKFLIKINDQPMIQWVVKMFLDQNCNSNDHFIFICRKEHQEQYNLSQILKTIVKNCEVITIENHKLGPVYAVSKAFDIIDNNQPSIISYCDYFMSWDYKNFKKSVLENQCDGSVPCYTNFHPHLLPIKNLYASCRIDDQKNLCEIKEKFSFNSDKTKAYHSPGVYYFKNGNTLKKYFQMVLDCDLSLNGEFYVSLVYQLMLKDNLKISVYDKIDYFCQWGTPEDLADFLFWINLVKNFKS